MEGKAYYLISISLTDANGNKLNPSGRRVWTQFLTWMNSGERKNTILNNIKRDLKALKLDGDDIDGFDYFNKFILHHNKLVEIGAKSSEPEILVNFVENIIDPDFDTVRQILENYNMEIDRGQRNLNTKEFFDMVESRQRSLNATTDADMDIKSRRISRGNDFLQSNSSRNSIQQALNLPRQLWTSLSIEQRKAFLAHKRAALDGKILSEDRLNDIFAGSSDNDGGQRKK